MRKILLIDPSEDIHTTLSELLRPYSIKLTWAKNLADGETQVLLSRPDLIISEAELPDGHIHKFRHWRDDLNLETPIMVITAKTNIISEEESKKLNIQSYFQKPFSKDAILKKILGLFYKNTPLHKELMDIKGVEDYIPIKIETFLMGSTIPYDLYIQIGKEKKILLAKKGAHIPYDQITRYKKKKLEYLFLKREDFQDYVGFAIRVTKIAKKKKINPKKIQKLLRNTTELIVGDLYINDISPEVYKEAHLFAHASFQAIIDNDTFADLMITLNENDNFLYSHCVGVAMTSYLIAKQMGWVNDSLLFQVFLAGLMHDIGFKEIDHSIFSKPRIEQSKEERQLLESHPTRGADILRQIPGVTPLVIQVCMQHHEDCIGTGYPKGIKKRKITPVARLLYVAEIFAELCIKNPREIYHTPFEAIEIMEEQYGDRMDGNYFIALKKLILGEKNVEEQLKQEDPFANTGHLKIA